MHESEIERESAREVGPGEILRDYRLAYVSRQASLIGRKEVFTGKAKFGIFGDGKELAQVAMARVFLKGDVRAGYYRDQTFMFALGMSSVEEFFAQLYAHADVAADPSSAGKQMTAHFATRCLDSDGNWKRQVDMFNSSADVSPTGSQMPRLVGLGYASRLFRELPGLAALDGFSRGGAEIAFGTIGNASCAEGMFWEAVNAIGVLRAPVLLSIWDDEYGISVHNEHQITKGDLTELLTGFRRREGCEEGFDVHTVRGWDYPALCETYRQAVTTVRRDGTPVIVHVTEMTQPQGHSTSGSHERYKDEERLRWERDHDCIRKMREWMVDQGVVTAEELDRVEAEDRALVVELKDKAWETFRGELLRERDEVAGVLAELSRQARDGDRVDTIRAALEKKANPIRRDMMQASFDALVATRNDRGAARERLSVWRRRQLERSRRHYGAHLYSESAESALRVEAVPPAYAARPKQVRGFEVLNACFDAALARDPRIIAFGEDVGQLGDVNQGLAGLQEKYGALRVADTGIREATIIGQAIGMAMRGLRPIVEIQYLDYVLYALQILSDDLATLRYRTHGGQKAPVIVRTRGHRLEGIWHSGSPMAGIIHLVRGMQVCVPRDMTRAAGFYNTLLRSDDPAMVVEVLNGYRLRERLPSNVGEFTVPAGVPEVLRQGRDVTLVTYGACCRIALDAATALEGLGVDVEIIDVQTLLPFDRVGAITRSLDKTSRVLFLDEDVPGGTTGYMMQQVLDEQDGWQRLDAPPRALSAQAHRPAYGSDGDYFSKPNREDVVQAVYDMMRESDPASFPRLD